MQKLIVILLCLISTATASDYWLKLDGETIISHIDATNSDFDPSEWDKKVPGEVTNKKGQYIYKYIGGVKVPLSQTEIDNHPLVIENKILEEMNGDRKRIEKMAKINRGGVNSNLLHLVKRLKPGTILALNKKVLGDGKSIYQRLQMADKPTFQELQDELIIYKTELINALGD